MPNIMLLGSNILPAHIWIKNEERQLGDVVRRAHKDSGLSVDAWNALSEKAREYLLVDAVYAMRAE